MEPGIWDFLLENDLNDLQILNIAANSFSVQLVLALVTSVTTNSLCEQLMMDRCPAVTSYSALSIVCYLCLLVFIRNIIATHLH